MFRLLIVFVFSIVLAGCASSPLDKVSNLPKKDLGQVASILYGNGEDDARLNADQTENFKHWRLNVGRLYNREKFAMQGLEENLSQFGKYCSALGGTLNTPYAYPDLGSRVRGVTCEQTKSAVVIFQVFAANIHCAFTQGQPSYDPAFQYSCGLWIDAFQSKSGTNTADLSKEYRLQSAIGGFATIQVADAAKQREQEERANKAKAFKAEFDKQWQLKIEKEQEAQAQAIRDQPQVKTVGQKVCRSEEITQRKVMGSAMGQLVYGNSIKLQAKVTAFTEKSAGSKIQVRISGIQANGENLDRIDGDVVLENGAIVWDEATHWGLCY